MVVTLEVCGLLLNAWPFLSSQHVQEDASPVRLLACGVYATVFITHAGNLWYSGRSLFDPKPVPSDASQIKK